MAVRRIAPADIRPGHEILVNDPFDPNIGRRAAVYFDIVGVLVAGPYVVAYPVEGPPIRMQHDEPVFLAV